MKIRAAVLNTMDAERPFAESQPLTVEELELDAPQNGEVLIRMTAAGVCHSDLSVVDGNRPRPLPMALGHEGTGVIEEVGPGIEGLNVGDHVVTVFLPRCEDCENCRTDGKLPCSRGTESNNSGYLPGGGHEVRLHRPDGSEVLHHLGVSAFATHAVVNQASVVKIGSDVPAEAAAPLGCAVLTGGGAVVNAGQPEEGDSIMVVGLGGVGIAALLTAIGLKKGTVIAVDAQEAKLSRAAELGADETYTPGQVSEQGIKANLVIEAAGHPKAFETAFNATAVGGRTVTVGLPSPKAESVINPVVLTAEARTVMGSYLGSAVPSRDIPRYEDLWRQGELAVEELVSSRIALDDINQAMDTLADAKAIRQVIIFDDASA
ncbi:alcohol dehydrogenase catalytic domain-containing protein [Curtobacterium sp. S6]|uniref:alcohol dehydrogenase catalytic domain-containing protein n=1 Tax=Curtobacterium sp. S6 TaxID=1479623 RepID=UPI0004AAEC57|nr:alcohol dehydrogenase catalytic domain-containing protein [Curtobacterium sp. S6]